MGKHFVGNCCVVTFAGFAEEGDYMSLADSIGISVEGIVGVMLGLILVYLLVKNADSVNTIFNALAGATMGVFGTLQGRPVNAFGVNLGA